MDNLFDENAPVEATGQEAAKTVFKKPYFSWSRLSMFLSCGVRYEFVYVKGRRAPPAVAMIAGSGTHIGIEHNLKLKRDTGKLMPMDQVIQVSREATSAIIERDGVQVNKDDLEEIGSSGDSAVKTYLLDRVEMFSRLHYTAMAPYIDPYLVEHSFRLVTKNFPFDLVGVVDLQRKPENKQTVGSIEDTKTKAKDDTRLAINSDQLTMYALWGRQAYGVIPPLGINLLIGTKTPKAYTQITQRCDADIEVLSRRIEAVADALQKGVFIPAPADSFTCSERWCGFAADGSCPYFRKKTTVSTTPKKGSEDENV